MPSIKKALTIRGRVQGVFFRRFTKENADELGLKGYVLNRSDGSVFCVVEGESEKVAELIRRLHIGPDFSRVDSVTVEDYSEGEEFFSYEIRY